MGSTIPSNYKPKHSERDIHKLLSLLVTSLKEELRNRFSLFEVMAPKYSTNKITSDIYENLVSRNIDFGTATDDEIYTIYNNYNYWFRNELIKLDIESNSALFSVLDYIARDQIDENDGTLRKLDLHMELRYDGETYEEKLNEVIQRVNQAIIVAAQRSAEKVPTKNLLGDKVSYFDFIEDGLDVHDSIKQIDALTEKEGLVCLTNVNSKKKREIFLSDEPIYGITTLWSPFSKEAHSIVKAGFRKPYEEIARLSKTGTLDSKDEIFFAKEILNKDVPNSIWVEIDIFRIAKAILGLAHIGELLPDDQNEEIERLKKSMKIKKI